MPKEQKLLNINILACSKAELYRAHAQKCKPLLHGTESSSMTILKYLVYRLNTTSEF